MSSGSLCCFLHYWSFNSPSSFTLLVCFVGKVISWLALYLSSRSCCPYQLYFCCSVSFSSRGFTKIGLRSSPIHSMLLLLILFSPIRQSVIIYIMLITIYFSFLLSPSNFHRHCTPANHNWSCLPVDNLPSFSHSISLKLKFFLLHDLPAQLATIHDSSLLVPSDFIIKPAHSGRNLNVILDCTLSLTDHISSVS